MSEPEVSRAVRALWGREDGPRRGPKPTMSVPAIAAAAVAIADEEGLDGVSMASVAKRLGYSAMSLYRYVDTKDDLIQVMLDAAYGPVSLPPAADDWRADANGWAHTVLARYLAHPWVVDVRMSSPPLTPNNVGWMDAGLSILATSGLPPAQVASSLLVLDSYVRAHVRLRREYSEEGLRTWSTRLRSVIDPEATPAVWASLQADVFDDDAAAEGDPWPADDFAFGLGIVLDGIQHLVDRASAP